MSKITSSLKSALKKAKSKSSGRTHELRDESLLRILCRLLQSKGITVRRENLSRGSAFRVKSGNCLLREIDLVFVDRRLPASQQLSLLLDIAVELKLLFSEEEVEPFPHPMQLLLRKSTPLDTFSTPAEESPALAG